MEIPNSEFHIETKPNICVDNVQYETHSGNNKHSSQVAVKCENNETYECNMCGKTFVFLVNMEEHIKSHSEAIVVKTKICVEPFPSDHSSESPVLLSEVKPYVGDQCGNIFKSLCAFELHTKDHDEQEVKHTVPLTQFCNEDPLASCSSVKTETYEQNEEKPYVSVLCDKCGNILDSLNAFELHVRDHNEYEVEYTYEKFCNADPLGLTCSSVKIETTEQYEAKPWVCNKCNLIFDSLSVFELHTKEHDEQEVKYTCDTFYDIDPLGSYTSVKTDTSEQNEKSWVCDKGGIIIDTLNSHELHIRDHTQNKHVEDALCNTEFKTESELQIHAEQIHTDVSMYNKLFTQVSSDNILEKNVETETDRNPYRCIWCKQSFDIEGIFKKHNHYSRTKSFHYCCEMTFECEGLLQVHVDTMHIKNTLENNDNEESFECKVCRKSFVGKDYFQMHICTQTVTCPTCKYIYNNSVIFKLHNCQEIAKSMTTCSKCNHSFQSRNGVLNHKCKSPHVCKTCNKSFLLKRDLKSHICTHTLCEIRSEPFPQSNQNLLNTHNGAKKRFICEMCNKSFTTKWYLTFHIRSQHTDEKPHNCEICNKSFLTKQNLQHHNHIHTGKKAYTCEICNKSFVRKQNLWEHAYTHTGEKPYTCEICNKSFVTRNTFRGHVYTHTGEKRYTCEICNKSFATRQSLQQHNHTHTGRKPYTCEICNKSFARKQNLREHAYTHTGEKSYTCEICNKSFVTRNIFREHVYTHTGEKRYTCEICNKSFATRQSLQQHNHTHTGKKPYTCEICNKSFAYKQNLREHAYTHTGEKPYTCEICNKSFITKRSLQRHNQTHTGKNPYTCEICNKLFRMQSSLRHHIRTHHANVRP